MEREQFLNPAIDYRGTDLWMLNDHLEAEELERQIEEMKKAGCGSFIARTFNGLRSDYPGEDFQNKLSIIVRKAKQEGLKVFLQAGFMPSGVPDLPPEYAEKSLIAVRERQAAPAGGQLMAEHEGTAYYLKTNQHKVDLLGEDAVKHYMQQAYDAVWQRFKSEFGKTIVSIWVDEPYFSPPGLPWNDQFSDRFQKMWGYRIEEHIPSLFVRTGDYRKIRYHYWRTVLAMLKQAYFQQVSDWCKTNKLMFSGHLMGEDMLETQIGYTASTMPLYKYMDIPGIDHLTGSLTWRHGYHGETAHYKFLMTPLQVSSAAHQAGKEKILCEMFGVSSEGIRFSDMRYTEDFFTSLGINHRCIHGLFYSLRGRRKRTYVPHVSYQQPWWKDFRTFLDYSARKNWLMRQGAPSADVLVLHPVESGFMEYECLRGQTKHLTGELPDEETPKIERMNRRFVKLLEEMMGMHVSFELGDEDTMAEWGKVTEDGRLQIGRMTYKTIVLPHLLVIRRSTWSLLKQFAERGGTIIALGHLPERVEGELENAAKAISSITLVHSFEDLHRKLLDGGCVPFQLEGDGDLRQVWMQHRALDRGKLLFVYNHDKEAEFSPVLKLNGAYTVEEWQPENGRVAQIHASYDGKRTSFAFRLPPGVSRVFLCRERAADLAAEMEQMRSSRSSETVSSSSESRNVQIESQRNADAKLLQKAQTMSAAHAAAAMHADARWKAERKDPNVLLLEFCKFKKGDGEYSELFPILAVQQMLTEEQYIGPITLQFKVEAEEVPNRVWLALEDPGECRIRVNGVDVRRLPEGYFWDQSFEKVCLSDLLRQGENVIELTRTFEPLQKPSFFLAQLFQNLSGTELEPVYLIGDFGVFGEQEPTSANVLRYQPQFKLSKEKKQVGRELTAEGYPFYAGTIALRTTLELDALPQGKRAILKAEGFRGVISHVSINGFYAGKIWCEPYELDATAWIRPGDNEVELEITNGLRNVIGPFHRPQGDLPHTWKDYPWTGEFNYRTGETIKDWYKHRMPDTELWTESYMLLPFGVDSITVYFE